jgi:hypothetical protein
MSSAVTHSNLYYNCCIVEDSLNLTGANTEAFHIGKCQNVFMNYPIVRAVNKSVSAYAGIRVFGSRKVTVNLPQIEKTQSHGIRIHDVADTATTNNGGAMEDITVNGGLLQSNPFNIHVDLLLANTRRIKIDGTTTDGGQYGLYVTTASNTATTRAIARMNILGATVETVFGTERWVMDLTGDVLGAMPAGAGSKYVNYANGQAFTRLGTSWYPVNLSGTTGNRSAGLAKGSQYYDMTINKPVWYDGAAWKDSNNAVV